MLSAIASSLITVTGTVFSLMIVALQLASGQMTPRLLRNFTGDRTVQIVLGILVGTFTYSIVVLRVIRSEDSRTEAFVPSLATTVAIVLFLVSVAALIFFIHHVSRLIQVNVVVGRTVERNLELVGRTRAIPDGARPGLADPSDWPELEKTVAVTSDRAGYVLAIDAEELFATCDEAGAGIRIRRAPGAFVVEGGVLADVRAGPDVSATVARSVRRAIVIGREPTGQADTAFPFRQIADIALRALSPGINDPSTAMVCVDRLGQLLAAAAHREPETTVLRAAKGPGILVLEPAPDLATLTRTAFLQIRHYGAADTVVMAHAIRTLTTVAAVVPDAARPVLLDEAERYLAAARRAGTPEDQPVIDALVDGIDSAR